MATHVLEVVSPAAIVELADYQKTRKSTGSRVSLSQPRPATHQAAPGSDDRPNSTSGSLEAGDGPRTSSNEQPRLKWNQDRITMWRIATSFLALMIMGLSDASYGALIGYIGKYYDLTYTVVSLLFLSPFAGYTLSALLNNMIHLKFGQRGVAIMLSTCHIVAFLAISLHPPYPALVFVFAITGFGNGLSDSCFNAWMGNMANANELLGLLHGFFGLGAVISPIIATSMVAKYGRQWYEFYYVMLGISVLEFGMSVSSFWDVTAAKYKQQLIIDSDGAQGGLKQALFKAPWARITWLCALLMLTYVGTEVTLGGWIVLFMQTVRQGEEFASGMTATGFWLGLMTGRVILGFVTPRIGEKIAISTYLGLAMGFQLLFWLVPQFYVSAVAVSLQGFFLGPVFPAVVVVATKLLPRHLHVTALGFAIAFGGSGAAVLPFMVGAIAQARGVQALQPIVLAFLVIILALWLFLARVRPKSE